MEHIYVSVDIETDGPCPGLNSILSLGAEATTRDSTVSVFSANLLEYPGAKPDPTTMEWWSRNPDAFDATRVSREPADRAMRRFVKWLEGLPGKVIFVGYPAGFDFVFVYFYLHALCGGNNPFVRNCIDMETLVMGITGRDYLDCSPDNWEEHWRAPLAYANHTALADAKAQAECLRRILASSRKDCWTENGLAPYCKVE